LTTVHFENLPSLETVGDAWLYDCAALTTVHFENLPSLETVGDFWLDRCAALTTVHFQGEMAEGLVIPEHLGAELWR
jgi:hypothetical protein